MYLWRRGRTLLDLALSRKLPDAPDPIRSIVERCPLRVPGTAVFMASIGQDIPPMLAHYSQRVGALHQTVLLLSIAVAHVPTVRGRRPLLVEDRGHGIYRVIARYGFMERPNVPRLLDQLAREQLPALDRSRVTYFVGRETFLATSRGAMSRILEGVFAWLSRNARPATAYFHLPPERIIEIGLQVDL
jgi:KUP system potassium uptake protein